MKVKSISIFIWSFFTISVFSQYKSIEEPLTTARTYIQQKDYKKAVSILENYYKNHSEDLETNWLYAQVAHWNGNATLSEQLFLKAIALAPDVHEIEMDYARTLYENGQLQKVNSLLPKLEEFPDTQAEALLMEANIAFWNGRVKEAKNRIAKIKTLYPDSHIADALTRSINEATTPYIKTLFEYQHDNQPVDFYAEAIEVGQYSSYFLNPTFEVKNYNFTPNHQVISGKLSNQLFILSIGLTTNYSLGVYKNFSDKVACIGSLDATLKVWKHTSINMGYNRKPYLGTLESTSFTLVQNNIFGAIEYNNSSLFSIHAGYNQQFFNDSNPVNSFSSWIISKPITFSKIKLCFGYGYSYSNADKNLFTAKESLADAIAQFSPNSTIEGYYNPYFTPKNQITHSVLVLFNYKVSKTIEWDTKANIGVYASCENPYIYLDTDTTGTTFFSKNSEKTTFSPYEINSNLNIGVSKNIQAKISFTQQQTFFYTRSLLGLGLNIKL
ncbi:tetratricopeptide repeat protein [Flavobacterium aciduliphilum]|uniref:Uncharacterized protein n=1 Tax=Flavobacterium aciduliphilum TaxID=1101402 RepID=A0A328YQK0_9FLAO|nr:tetratricopeptide repeat protein [Flavobacterium aciduliphilum]RAR75413.1 hypothetical protein CLV55_101108 [Flavobacterium aciduliphilum]